MERGGHFTMSEGNVAFRTRERTFVSELSHRWEGVHHPIKLLEAHNIGCISGDDFAHPQPAARPVDQYRVVKFDSRVGSHPLSEFYGRRKAFSIASSDQSCCCCRRVQRRAD
eukprot:scaffold192727_cov31-Tisochrysis_lutea.AAC.4